MNYKAFLIISCFFILHGSLQAASFCAKLNELLSCCYDPTLVEESRMTSESQKGIVPDVTTPLLFQEKKLPVSRVEKVQELTFLDISNTAKQYTNLALLKIAKISLQNRGSIFNEIRLKEACYYYNNNEDDANFSPIKFTNGKYHALISYKATQEQKEFICSCFWLKNNIDNSIKDPELRAFIKFCYFYLVSHIEDMMNDDYSGWLWELRKIKKYELYNAIYQTAFQLVNWTIFYASNLKNISFEEYIYRNEEYMTDICKKMNILKEFSFRINSKIKPIKVNYYLE